jgi:glycosyltransferase involved in cell wall biosynthesis
MLASACLCVFNEIEMLPRTLAYLDTVEAVGEIVVVDSGSTDGTQDLLKSWRRSKPLRWRARPLDTFSGQRNAAAAMAGGDWLLMIDADETYTPAVGRLLEELAGRGDVNAVRLGTALLWPDEWHYLADGPVDPHCRIIRRGFAWFAGTPHERPLALDGRDLHTCIDPDVLLCWESPAHADCWLLHAQLLKSDPALAAKSARWAELGWYEGSKVQGRDVPPSYWLDAKGRAAGEKIEPLPAAWRS